MAFIQLPKLFSQRDPIWVNDKHGTSSSTIGKTGCTISLLTAILVHAGYNETPKTVDDKLTANGGYSNGNLINWLVVPKLWPRLKWVYRHYSYNNDLAAEWIKKGMVPMIEVKADPIGGAPGGKHWVGFLGDQKSYDPWIGALRDNKIWTATGMALYEYVPGLPGEGENMEISQQDFDRLMKASRLGDRLINGLGTAFGDDSELYKGNIADKDESRIDQMITRAKSEREGKKSCEAGRDKAVSEAREAGKKEGYETGFKAGVESVPTSPNPTPQPVEDVETGKTKYKYNEKGQLIETVTYQPKV